MSTFILWVTSQECADEVPEPTSVHKGGLLARAGFCGSCLATRPAFVTDGRPTDRVLAPGEGITSWVAHDAPPSRSAVSPTTTFPPDAPAVLNRARVSSPMRRSAHHRIGTGRG